MLCCSMCSAHTHTPSQECSLWLFCYYQTSGYWNHLLMNIRASMIPSADQPAKHTHLVWHTMWPRLTTAANNLWRGVASFGPPATSDLQATINHTPPHPQITRNCYRQPKHQDKAAGVSGSCAFVGSWLCVCMVTLRQFVVMWVAWVFGVEDCGLLVARVPVLCVEGCGLLVAAFQWSDWGGRLSGPSCGCTNGSCASVGNVVQCVRVCVGVCECAWSHCGCSWSLVVVCCQRCLCQAHFQQTHAEHGAHWDRCYLQRWYMSLLFVRCFAPCMSSVLLLLIASSLLLKQLVVASCCVCGCKAQRLYSLLRLATIAFTTIPVAARHQH